MKTRPLALLLALAAVLFALWTPALVAKPKVEVQVKVNEGAGKDQPADSLSRTGSSYEGKLNTPQIYFFNVIITSENAEAVAKNNGQWCIKGDILLGSITYHGTLNGNDLEIEMPQPNGKIKKVSFGIYDHKWRKLSDL